MNLNLHLPTETEAKLKEQASRAGKSPEELALEALEEKLEIDAEPAAAMSPGEQLAAFRAWVESRRAANPSADLSREAIYDNRGE